ncbi:MAG: hypothetical protein AB7K24_10885 [Gemmataceae bacterium]
MNGELTSKIARLIEEGAWTQESFAEQAGLNRHTVRKILFDKGTLKLRNATVSACAGVLGFSVNELRGQPLERLLPRVRQRNGAAATDSLQRLYDEATQPQLQRWLEANPGRARELSREEIDEICSVQGVGGPLDQDGLERFVALIERKRKLIQQVHAVAGTEHLELLEKFVTLLYNSIQPYGDRR